ncbi:TolC family protein [Sphingomonas sp. LH128]|uniref:TolC family protein n=1 Tax=Sphingomonas sp. LH128 TaxID=473781 RepID=UPI002E13249C
MSRKLVQAADKGVEYAKKSFLPDISLSGLIGLSSLGISHLFDGGSDYGSAGAAVSLPIFQGGALSGRYRLARGGYDTMVASYNKSVIGALQEVADALSTRTSAGEQERHALEARTEANAAYGLALQRYKGGLSTYIDVLSAETTALDTRLGAVDAHFATLASEVALKRALGGGYADDSAKKATPDESRNPQRRRFEHRRGQEQAQEPPARPWRRSRRDRRPVVPLRGVHRQPHGLDRQCLCRR